MALSSITVGASAVATFPIGSSSPVLTYQASTAYSGGDTIDGSANIMYAREHTITSGVALSLDLAGSLTQPDGVAAVFVEVVSIFIKHISGTGYLTIGGGGSAIAGIAGFAGVNGYFAFSHDAGAPVAAGSADILQVTSSSGVIVCDIVIVGRTA